MLAFLASLLFFQAEEAESVPALLAKAGPANAKQIRLDALEKLSDQLNRRDGEKPQAPAEICKVLEDYASETDIDIRRKAFTALGITGLYGQRVGKMDCPLLILKAMNDEDDQISGAAQGIVIISQRFSKNAIPLLIEAAEANDISLHLAAVQALARVASDSPDAMKTLKKLMEDPAENIVNLAHQSHFEATNDFPYYVKYLLKSSSSLNAYPPATTDIQKRNETGRAYRLVGVAMKFHNFAEHRPKDLAKALIENLSHKDARVRQSALLQIRGMCIASHETYQAIPKAKAQTEIQKLFEDKNEKVRSWAYLAYSCLEDGPSQDAPKKLGPFGSPEPGSKAKPQPGEMP